MSYQLREFLLLEAQLRFPFFPSFSLLPVRQLFQRGFYYALRVPLHNPASFFAFSLCGTGLHWLHWTGSSSRPIEVGAFDLLLIALINHLSAYLCTLPLSISFFYSPWFLSPLIPFLSLSSWSHGATCTFYVKPTKKNFAPPLLPLPISLFWILTSGFGFLICSELPF